MKKVSTVFILMICGFLICLQFANLSYASIKDTEFLELCRTGSLEQVNDAIMSGANVNLRTGIKENTLLMETASSNPDPKVITALIDVGAVVSRKNNFNETPLMYAAGNNKNQTSIKAVIQALVDAGDEIDARDNGGRTPLMWAVNSANLEAVVALLSLGADAKQRDRHGTLPLDAAEAKKEFKNTDAVKKLREASK